MTPLPIDTGSGQLPYPDGAAIRRRFEVVLVALTAAFADTAIFAAAIDLGLGLWPALSGHLLISALLTLWLLWLRRRDGGLRMATLLVMGTATMGPIGAGGTLLAMVLWSRFMRNNTPFEDWYASLFPEQQRDPALDLYRDLKLGRDAPGRSSTVTPFIDVMRHGSVPQKQAVIALIADNFRTSFASALRRALNDPEPGVRVQAATAVARIEGAFLQRSMELEAWRAGHPGDADAILGLARHLDDYATTGLLDRQRAEESRRTALGLFEQALQSRPDDVEIQQAIERLLVRLSEHERTVAWFAARLDSVPTDSPRLIWYFESLFRLGRFGELRRVAAARGASFASAIGMSDEVRAAAELWASAGKPGGEP